MIRTSIKLSCALMFLLASLSYAGCSNREIKKVAHGTQDWGAQTSISTVHKLQDMAELAARLGSINTFHRTGNIIWMDDFEGNINKWRKSILPAGGTFVLSTDTCRNNAKSCKLTTIATAGHSIIIYRVLPYPILSSLGAECSFTIVSDSSSFAIELLLFDGSQFHWAYVVYNHQTGQLKYKDINNLLITFQTITPLYASPYMFHTWKLTADFINKRYIKLIIDSSAYSLAGIPFYSFNSPTTPSLRFAFTSGTNINLAINTYLDDVIITQNEL